MTKNNKLWLLAAAAIVLVPAALYSVQVLGYQDLQIITAPGNPPSGFLRFSAQTGTLGCLTSAGANCLSGASPGGTAGGDLSGTYPNPTVAKINGASVPSNCALTTLNGSAQLACQTAKGLASVAYAAGAGTANAQTVTYSPAVAALADIVGYPICWLPSNANSTTTPTLAVNGLTAKTIVKTGGAALAASDLTTTAVACVIWDGTSMELQNPQTGGGSVTSVTATAPLTSSGGSTPVISATYQGNGAKVQASTGSTTTGDCVQFDANGNTVDAGAACGAGSGGAMAQLGQCTLTAGSWTCTGSGSGPATTSVSFTSISGSYNQLQIWGGLITDRPADSDSVLMTFNSDTSASYAYQLTTFAGSVSASQGNAQTSLSPGYIGATSAGSGDTGTIIISIPSYAQTVTNKTYHATSTIPTVNPGVNGRQTQLGTGFWHSTSAITTIKLAPGAGANFASGSIVTLYGIN